MTLAQVVVSQLRSHLEAAAYQQAFSDPLFAGMIASLGLAAFFGWRRSGTIENMWQRGVIAVLAAVGALVIGFLAALADRLLGLAGLILWGGLALSFGIAASRWATRGGAVPGGAA
jgi:lipopolysaccharide export LptBFGC system permease protein LptF